MPANSLLQDTRPIVECWGSCPALLLVMLLRTQLPFGHWLFIVGYNVTFDRPPRRQRMPTCADNGHRAFKSADPAHRRLLFLLVFSTRILFVRLSYLAVAFGPDMDLMASLDGTLMRPPLDPQSQR